MIPVMELVKDTFLAAYGLGFLTGLACGVALVHILLVRIRGDK